jgi:hypothetical protein
MQEWDDVAKADWILKYGKPDIAWIFERVDNVVYKRPIQDLSRPVPPWISLKRQVAFVTNGDTFIDINSDINTQIKEHTDD